MSHVQQLSTFLTRKAIPLDYEELGEKIKSHAYGTNQV